MNNQKLLNACKESLKVITAELNHKYYSSLINQLTEVIQETEREKQAHEKQIKTCCRD